MRTVLDEGSIVRNDDHGNKWIGTWVAWVDELERKVEVHYSGKTKSISITEAQDFTTGRLQVAGTLFENILRELGHFPKPL